MGNQQGTAVYVNDQQYQRSADTDGLRKFFSEMRLERDKAFLDDIKYVFQNGSQNRKHFFANVRYRDYATYERGLSYMMPFYGVTGKVSAITSRVSYYTELLVCHEDELAGTGFADLVFGTDYMRDSEAVASSRDEVIAVIERNKLPVRHSFSENEIEPVCRIVSKLWEAQEADPSTRFIIQIEKADERSMELLQKIYLLLPHYLRLQLGFETNITEKDLKLIQDRGGFPVYILTAEREESFDSKAFSFPIVIFDVSSSEDYIYDENKMSILRSVAKDMNELEAVLLDYSEKKVIETKDKNYSSFRYYEELVTNMNTVEYWWKSEDIDTVEQLKGLYDDQKELLKNDMLKKEAVNEFLTNIMPQDKLSEQLSEIIVDENYKDRKGLLRFLAEELYQKTQINALNKTYQKAIQKNEILLKEKDEEYQEKIDELNKKHSFEVQAEKKKNSKLTSENNSFKKELETAHQENAKLSKNNTALKKKLDEAGNTDSGNKYKRQVKELDQSLRTQRIITAVSALLLVAAIAFGAITVTRSGKLKAEITEKEQQVQNQMKVAQEAKTRSEELENELNELKEILNQQEENAQDNVESSEQQTENAQDNIEASGQKQEEATEGATAVIENDHNSSVTDSNQEVLDGNGRDDSQSVYETATDL